MSDNGEVRKELTVTIEVADVPEVKAALNEAAETIERLRHERDEWEQRYEELLAACGGVMPG